MVITTEAFYYRLGLYETYLIVHTDDILRRFYDMEYVGYNRAIKNLMRLVNE